MPRRQIKPHELTTDEAMRRLFPAKVREEAKREGQKARKSEEKPSIPRKAT
jgi:hypothetical protein